jgi:hypothetical protein
VSMRMKSTLLFIWAVCVPAIAQQASFNEVLVKVAAYKVGDDEKPLADMHRLVARATASPETVRQMEQAFLKALEGAASLEAKSEICRHLMLIGSSASVPELSKLLNSAETADIARYALERIPNAAVDEALRGMLAKSSGKVKIGVVNTLGRRKDAGSVAALRSLIDDSDPAIAAAAAAA